MFRSVLKVTMHKSISTKKTYKKWYGLWNFSVEYMSTENLCYNWIAYILSNLMNWWNLDDWKGLSFFSFHSICNRAHLFKKVVIQKSLFWEKWFVKFRTSVQAIDVIYYRVIWTDSGSMLPEASTQRQEGKYPPIKVLQCCILKFLLHSFNSVPILYRIGNMQSAILFVARTPELSHPDDSQ